MRRKHIVITIIISAISLCGVSLLAMILYTGQDRVPARTEVAGLPIGGLQVNKALLILQGELALIEQLPVVYEIEQSRYTMTWKESGVTYEVDEFISELTKLTEGGLWDRFVARQNFPQTWNLHTQYNENILKGVFDARWEKTNFGIPVNAVRSIADDDTISYLPGQPVQRIHWSLLTSSIKSALPTSLKDKHSGIDFIKVPLHAVQPEITIDTLKKEGVQRKIAQYVSSLQTSGEGRIYNVDAVARALNGTKLKPQEVFDYAGIVDAAEASYGFREAPVIFGGKLVPGIGGGICQVSSTLYNAALLAGVDIVERRNHSLPVSYVPKGQDATFAKGYINFKFKNTTPHHLIITAKVTQGNLTIKLFGDIPENVRYTVHSQTTKVLPITSKYVVNSALSPGEHVLITPGKAGYIVESYRIKTVDGKQSDKVLLSRDTYASQPEIIAIYSPPNQPQNKTKAPDKKPKPNTLLEDGVKGPQFQGN